LENFSYIACPWNYGKWYEGDESKLPVCKDDTWADAKFSKRNKAYL